MRGFRCHVCHCKPDWNISRRGDSVVDWACREHLSAVCSNMQKEDGLTELVVRDHHRAADRVQAQEPWHIRVTS